MSKKGCSTTDGLNSSNGHKKTAHAKISPLLDSELFERSLYIPLHNRINQRIQDGSPFFSLEVISYHLSQILHTL